MSVLAHGDQGLDVLGNDENQFISSQQLADMLVANLNRSVIQKLFIKLFSCHGGADFSRADETSFANRLFNHLIMRGVNNFVIVASPDLATIKQHPTTKQIMTYLETAGERTIRQQYHSEREKILRDVISDFGWTSLSSTISQTLEQQIIAYVFNHLTPQHLLNNGWFDVLWRN